MLLDNENRSNGQAPLRSALTPKFCSPWSRGVVFRKVKGRNVIKLPPNETANMKLTFDFGATPAIILGTHGVKRTSSQTLEPEKSLGRGAEKPRMLQPGSKPRAVVEVTSTEPP